MLRKLNYCTKISIIIPSDTGNSSVVGPMIGGALADPLKTHPEWFNGAEPAFFVKFPFALPSIVASFFFVIGLPIGFLFLDVRDFLYITS